MPFDLYVSGMFGVWILKEDCFVVLCLKLDSAGSALKTMSTRWRSHLQVGFVLAYCLGFGAA